MVSEAGTASFVVKHKGAKPQSRTELQRKVNTGGAALPRQAELGPPGMRAPGGVTRSHRPVSGLGQPATSWPAPVSTLRGPLRLRDSVIDGICLTTPFWDSPQDFTDALRMTSPTAIFATTSMPLMTRPKTTYFPSRRGTALSVTAFPVLARIISDSGQDSSHQRIEQPGIH